MATTGRDSSLQLIFEQVASAPSAGTPDTPRGETISGAVLGCTCPDCGGPVTIRLWLMTADCWQCGTSIELSLEQERALRRKLKVPAAPAPAAPQESSPPPPAVAPRPAAARIVVPPPPPVAATAHAAALPAMPEAQYYVDHWLRDLTAWLTSAIFHTVLILLLGMWTLSSDPYEPELVLSVTLSKTHRTGGEPSEVEFNTTEFDLPIDEQPETDSQREVLLKANQDARELRLDPGDPQENLPDINRVRADLKSSDPYRRMQAARDPRVRAEVVAREGGTTLTEAAVARGLRWMAGHQAADGAWSIDRFRDHGDCQGRCDGAARIQSDSAGTALVLMAMLGTGQTHQVGIYREQVGRGLAWLVRNQEPDGDLRAGSHGNAGMYAHALAAIALCDAFKMSGDETLRGPAQRAVDFICAAQHANGGWRYHPNAADGDTSVVGWQLMALHSARSAYLDVPQTALTRADQFLDRMQQDDLGGSYAYRRGQRASPTMTSVGLLSRMYLGWDRSRRGLADGVEALSTDSLPDASRGNVYYWYYATQVMHHWGGEPWERWNRHIREALVTTQVTTGHEAGSWPPSLDPHGQLGGRLYVTALATCTLEVYYRYAPLYYQLELDK